MSEEVVIPDSLKWVEAYINDNGLSFTIPSYKMPRFYRMAHELAETKRQKTELMDELERRMQDTKKRIELESALAESHAAQAAFEAFKKEALEVIGLMRTFVTGWEQAYNNDKETSTGKLSRSFLQKHTTNK